MMIDKFEMKSAESRKPTFLQTNFFFFLLQLARLNQQLKELRNSVAETRENTERLSRSVDSYAHAVEASAADVTQAIGDFVDSVSDSIRLAGGVNTQAKNKIYASHEDLSEGVATREAALERLEHL